MKNHSIDDNFLYDDSLKCPSVMIMDTSAISLVTF